MGIRHIPAKTMGVRSMSGMVAPSIRRSVRRADILSDAYSIARFEDGLEEIPRIGQIVGMVAAQPIPAKLRAKRVRIHVQTTLIAIIELRVDRDASRCRSIDEVSWESFDLYTIALDLADEPVLRDLVAQARGTIASHLMR